MKKVLRKRVELGLDDPCWRNERFRFSYVFEKSNLKESLRLSGLIYPPWGIEEKGSLVLVSGWKRVLLLQELGWSTIPVEVKKERDIISIWQQLILENKSHRELSLVDKAFILKKVMAHGVDQEKIIQNFCGWLDIPPQMSWVERYVRITELDKASLEFIYQKKLPEYIIRFWLEYSAEERQLLIPWLVPLSQNKIKEVLEWLKEIALRDNLTPEQIVADFNRSSSTEEVSKSLAPPAEAFRDYLRQKRYPAYTQALARYKSILREIGWPENIELSPFPYFEKDEFQVSFTFSNEKEFRKKVDQLVKLSKTSGIKKIFFFQKND